MCNNNIEYWMCNVCTMYISIRVRVRVSSIFILYLTKLFGLLKIGDFTKICWICFLCKLKWKFIILISIRFFDHALIDHQKSYFEKPKKKSIFEVRLNRWSIENRSHYIWTWKQFCPGLVSYTCCTVFYYSFSPFCLISHRRLVFYTFPTWKCRCQRKISKLG